MQFYQLRKILFYLSGFLLFAGNLIYAQMGYSTGTMARAEQKLTNGSQLTAPEVVVEELINYHRHNIPIPDTKEGIGVEVKWGNTNVPGRKVVQVGIASAFFDESQQAPPVNLVVVVDRSGSMSGKKIEHTRQALKTLVYNLRPFDRFSLIYFDHITDVVFPSQMVREKERIYPLINGLQPRGSTDLHSAIMRGYQELTTHYLSGGGNRLLILTDAITNTGVVDPSVIVQQSYLYRKELKTDITMVGVGADLNHDLARSLSSNSQSSFHFINQASDIQKVFQQEVQSLLAPIGHSVNLTLSLPPGLLVEHLYGYQPTYTGNRISIPLNNINAGLTQVVLLDVHMAPGADKQPIEAYLTYEDIRKNQRITRSARTVLKAGTSQPLDADLAKNHLIARLANVLNQLPALLQQGNHHQAYTLLDQVLRQVSVQYPSQPEAITLVDSDVKRVANLVQGYRDRIQLHLSTARPHTIPQD